jgi:hypothetical protein
VDGITYHLESNTSVKQATEAVSVALADEEDIFVPVYQRQKIHVPVIKEAAVESESKFKSSTCSVRCMQSSNLCSMSNTALADQV